MILKILDYIKILAIGTAVMIISCSAEEACVERVTVAASGMDRDVNVVYIIPDSGPAGTKYPVLYLLHGHGDTHESWITKKPELTRLANEMGIMIVCPDGSYSWYLDSPVLRDFMYETFISKDLIKYTDENYPTIPERSARAIAGLSMGGHGAMWNAIRNKDVFGAVGSMSGGVDFSYDSDWADYWHLKDILGERSSNTDIWKTHTAYSQLDKLNNGDLAIIMDCGTEDFFYTINENMHNGLLERGIEHEYSTRPGRHNWEFWTVSIETFLKFFENYFQSTYE